MRRRAAPASARPTACTSLRPERIVGRDRLQAGEQRRQVRRIVGRSTALERLHHALADAAGRHVDHPPQADVVVRVQDELEVGQRVLDLLALVEPDAADDLVGNAGAAEGVFERSRLRVGAVEDRDGVLRVVVQRAFVPCAR